MGKITTDRDGALKEARGMQKTNNDLDDDGDSADRTLAEICSKFKLSKDFDIKGDKSGGGDGALAGMAGILGQ